MAVMFGEKVKIEIYGQSHTPSIGVKIDGLPAGKRIDLDKLQAFLERRAPGRNAWSTSRKEPDRPVFLSGIKTNSTILETDGNTLIAEIRNTNIKPDDYKNTSVVPRPGHADYPAWVKYGEIASGGGAFSARMTAPLCVAGGIFIQWLAEMGIEIQAHIRSIGEIDDVPFAVDSAGKGSAGCIAEKAFPVIDDDRGEEMKALIAKIKEEGDSIGGSIECMITGFPAGVGEPIFGSIESRICQAVFAVPAVKGIEFGKGFAVSKMIGSENNDAFCIEDGKIITKTNNHGGILGGLSSGMPIVFGVAMKPTPSIAKEQESVNVSAMEETTLQVKGRHDPCIVPRAVPCIEAAAAIAIGDMLLEEGLLGSTPREMDLQECRHQIDRIDKELVKLLEDRFDVAEQVIRYKEKVGMPILDSAREKALLDGLSGLCREETLTYIRKDFEAIMAGSRAYQQDRSSQYGLLGKNLAHSHSPRIHKMLGGYEYRLINKTEEELDAFLRYGRFKGINVTIPYKRAVIPYCQEISDMAKACNSINTIVRREDGTLYGDNTDYYGFRYLAEQAGIDMIGAKALVLGSGGVSGTVQKVLKDLGVDPVVVISRTGEDHYGNLDRHGDARIIVNATPVGMYPKVGIAPVDLRMFPECSAVFDLIYNPLRTKLILDAQNLGIPAFGGLPMLVAQAAAGCKCFTGQAVSEDQIRAVAKALQLDLGNVVLIGMPGCGKTTVGKLLSQKTGRDFVDLDQVITQIKGITPEEIIRTEGVDRFRTIETETLRSIVRDPLSDVAAKGVVLATGGGIVEREENLELLRENGAVIYLRRPLADLPSNNRPVTQAEGTASIYERRHNKYEDWSDFQIDNKTPAETAEIIEQTVHI